MKQFFFECQPWELEREGAEEALARLAGEIGVDGIHLHVSSSGGAALYPRGPMGPRIDSCDKGLQFQLDASKYASVRVRPRIAAWMKSRNPLEAVCKLAERHRLKVRAALPVSIPMPERSTVATIINALGDVSPHSLCFAHPDTQELHAALIEDLSSNYPIDVVEIAAPRRPRAQAAYDVLTFPSPSSDGEPFSECLAWCFCPSCRQQAQAAGVDIALVQKKITDLISSLPAMDAAPREWKDVVAEVAALAGYERWQDESARTLVRQLRERCRKSLSLRLEESRYPVEFAARHALRTWEGISERMSLRAVRGGLPDEPRPVRKLGSALAAVRNESPPMPGELKIDLLMPSRPPDVRDGPHLVSLTHEAAQTGCETIVFQDYATSPDACLDWVRQAIRFARRESQ
ncbi:MAG: hypothetical protein HBSAPP02_20790 [Phycisphaerae bacterium]|nr:MAG: hypothetical protein HRU71_05320 [Planctomycetia bacterium]RIK69944.1 MAG: hypothetical protein DCC66_06935 [Planctomycetota bacterium]GJQ27047.1 MAG: hypothetical protein HBSAPP02_20790 [Phycisphaerae bacterium]